MVQGCTVLSSAGAGAIFISHISLLVARITQLKAHSLKLVAHSSQLVVHVLVLYTRCVYLIPGRPKSSALRCADSFFHEICFIALSVLKSFCFSLFRQSFTWLAVADPPFIFLSLPPPILRYSDFMKSLVTARKSFIRSRKLSRRSTMTTLRREHSYKRLSKGEIWERAAAAAVQKNRTPTVSVAGIAAEVENDRRESVMKLTQAHDVLV